MFATSWPRTWYERMRCISLASVAPSALPAGVGIEVEVCSPGGGVKAAPTPLSRLRKYASHDACTLAGSETHARYISSAYTLRRD